MLKNIHLTAIAAVLALAACTSPHPNAVNQIPGHEVALYVTPGTSDAGNDLRVEVRGPRIPEISSISISQPQSEELPREIALEDAGTGSYSANGVLFPKSGKWHIAVLERRGATTEQLTAFDVDVR
jgi:hypothetical protein